MTDRVDHECNMDSAALFEEQMTWVDEALDAFNTEIRSWRFLPLKQQIGVVLGKPQFAEVVRAMRDVEPSTGQRKLQSVFTEAELPEYRDFESLDYAHQYVGWRAMKAALLHDRQSEHRGKTSAAPQVAHLQPEGQPQADKATTAPSEGNDNG